MWSAILLAGTRSPVIGEIKNCSLAGAYCIAQNGGRENYGKLVTFKNLLGKTLANSNELSFPPSIKTCHSHATQNLRLFILSSPAELKC